MLKKNKREIETKEDFCPICLVGIPLIFSSITGTATMISNKNQENIDENLITVEELEQINAKKRLKEMIIFWSGIIFFLSFMVFIYLKFIKGPCDECR